MPKILKDLLPNTIGSKFTWNSSLHIDKYEYVRTNPYVIRLIGLLGIAATLCMGYGFTRYLYIDRIFIFIFGPIIFINVVNKLLRFTLQIFYPKFDIQKHEQFVRRFWLLCEEPSVDIFLPWAGEDIQVHEEVLRAVSHMNYSNYKVYMLDDVGNENHKRLAEKYKYTYLSRPNKGEYKKSGNLQFGYSKSSGKYIFILDADFIPEKDALKDLVPYIESDETIGILQTPQYFEQTDEVHKRSKIEFGGGNIVEDFYRIIMPCRDEFKAATCVGTSALYRRETIDKLDGTPKVHASEDLATGLIITKYGYHVKYLPLIVSMGKSPDTFQGYFKQHMRWCSGNLVFIKFWPLAHMSLVTRIIYLVNPLYYLSEALTVLFSFQFLALLYFHPDNLSIINTIYFLPYIILSRIIIPLGKKNKNRLGTKLAALNNAYTYFYTYLRMFEKGIPEWQPTGVKFEGLHKDFINAFNLGTLISTSFVITFIYVLVHNPSIFGNYNAYLVIGWGFYSALWHALFLTFVMTYIHPLILPRIQGKMNLAFHYTRTYIMIILFLTLTGAMLSGIFVAVYSPTSPVIKALRAFSDYHYNLANVARAYYSR